MDITLVIGIISALVALLGGTGGIFAFIISRQKNSHDEHSSSVLEWKQLYDEMKDRLDAQENYNQKLREEIHNLKKDLSKLSIEIEGYKKFDNYIYDLENYSSILLETLKSIISEDAYNILFSKKPHRIVNSKYTKNKIK